MLRSPLLVAAGLALAGCTSGLQYTVDDQTIAGVSLQERAGVLDAQNEVNQAKLEQQKRQSELKQTTALASQSDSECANAEKASSDAVVAQKKAEQGGDMEAINTANRNKEVTEAGAAAADAKRDYLQKKQRALEAAVRADDKHVLAAQARYELEKAKVVQAKQAGGQGFELARFEAQYQEFQNDYQSAKNDADLKMTDANEAERAWKEADKKWQEMRGGKSS
jgi:hypothetical protein